MFFVFVDTKGRNPEVIIIDDDDCNNNDENDIGGGKDNPKTKHKENRYTGISITFSIVFANFVLRPNIYCKSIAIYFAYLLRIFFTKINCLSVCVAISCEVDNTHHSRPGGVKNIDKTFEKYR